MTHLVHLAQTSPYDSNASAGALLVIGLIALVVGVFFIAAYWRIFTKAGEPGWAAIIPIYNTYILLKITGKAWWWLLLLCIPLVNFILLIILYIDLARVFGLSGAFAVGLIFLPIIFFPILAFGSATYQGTPAQ